MNEEIILTEGQVTTVTEVQTDLASFIEDQKRLLEDQDRIIAEATAQKQVLLDKLAKLLPNEL